MTASELELGPMPDDALAACEEVLQYRFQDRRLLQQCLTHASLAKTRLESNERLEFLGDAILGVAVCELLYRRFPEEAEGELTRIKSVAVSRTVCASISEELRLDRWLQVGKGLGGDQAVPSSIMAAVFESLVAGVYLDGGWEAARSFVERLLWPQIEAAASTEQGRNHKSLLQQYAQKTWGTTPVYLLLDEKGPDHSKLFHVAASIGSETYPPAWGSNKKEAEQRAAEHALNRIERELTAILENAVVPEEPGGELPTDLA